MHGKVPRIQSRVTHMLKLFSKDFPQFLSVFTAQNIHFSMHIVVTSDCQTLKIGLNTAPR